MTLYRRHIMVRVTYSYWSIFTKVLGEKKTHGETRSKISLYYTEKRYFKDDACAAASRTLLHTVHVYSYVRYEHNIIIIIFVRAT